jgi:hypothetical protein
MSSVGFPWINEIMKNVTIQRGWMLGVALSVAVWAGRSEGAAAQLRVTTVPAGATVICDGILREAAPVTIDGLAPGPHLVSVELSGYVPERKTVMLVAEEKAAVEIKLEQEMGLVLVHSNPGGAEVVVDGAHRGKTPLLITDLPRGVYRVKAALPGYKDREVELRVEGRTPKQLMLALDSDAARLVINSKPEGATVVVNGLSKGVTPCIIERMPAGESKIALTLTDYASYQDTVTLRAGDDHKVEVELTPMPASVSVVGSPAGAKVYVNEQLRGQVPLSIGTIAPGSYTVRVEMAGYESESRSIELKNRDARTEEFNLTRNVGTLEVLTDQPGTRVIVNGEDKGLIPVRGEKSMDSLRIELPVGECQVEFRKKGYFSLQKTVTIVKGGNVSLKEPMKRNFVADTVVRLKTKEVVAGVVGRKLPNGDVEVETRPGIFRTITADEILVVESVEGAKP